MRTVLLFLFLACLSVLMYCAAAARWLALRTCPALLERYPVLPARHGNSRNKPGAPACLAAIS